MNDSHPSPFAVDARSGDSDSDSIPGPVDDWLDLVARHVRGTRYGVVMITVHDARVVQVEWTQRSRFDTGERRKG